MKNWGLSIFLATLFATSLSAQHNCGVGSASAKQIMQQMRSNRNEMRDYVFERNAITYVPVRFFLVAKSDGTGRTSERAGIDALCLLNENYADQNIQFYLKEFKYINSSTIYSNPGSFSGANAISNQMIYNAINVFIVNEMAEEGVLAYYQPEAGPSGNDWIVCLETYAGHQTTLTHEFGHFFSLPHPFNGWDQEEWDPAIHGNPVGIYSPDGTLNELVNGSNCSFAGDEICDTPADYLFPNNNCSYTLNAKDPNGQLLSPDIHNFMNYIFNCDDYYFTDDQKAEIQNSLFSNKRNYIRPNYTPNLATVTGAPTLVNPLQNQTVNTYNSVELEWTALAGADRYLVEIIHQDEPARRYIVTANSTTITDLSPNTAYLWKVMGFNEYSTCGDFSSQRILKTGSLVSDTSTENKVSNWDLTPNPARIGLPIYLNFETSEPVETSIEVYSSTGQLIHKKANQKFAVGVNTIELETGVLPAGMYFVTMKTPNGATTKRFAVAE